MNINNNTNGVNVKHACVKGNNKWKMKKNIEMYNLYIELISRNWLEGYKKIKIFILFILSDLSSGIKENVAMIHL